MIEEIYIRDLGVIREAKLELGPGFNALTGETGAGKTMILTALGLLLGERADSAAVRQGQEQTLVEGHWAFVPDAEVLGQLRDRLAEAGIDLPDEQLLVTRSVSADGRSRAAMAGRSVPVSVLSEIGENLVVVHGQSDQIRLRSAAAQREALDAFAGESLQELLQEYARGYGAWRETEARLDQLRSQAAIRVREAEDLRAAVAELEQVKPQPAEDLQLAELAERLTNTEDIRVALSSAHEALSSEAIGEAQDAIGLLATAKRALDQGAQYDPRLSGLADQLRELGGQVREVATELASHLASLESDSELSLDQVQERRAQINSLLRRFGPTMDELLAYQQNANARLLDLDSSDFQIEELERSLEQQKLQVVDLAARISSLRMAAARNLTSQVTEELHALAMPGATLVVRIEPADLGPHGADQIAILLSSYPGAEPRPLGKGASGGELSRIMLAIEVVLAKTKTNPTFIFDEVDAGVGGAAAIEIGKRLARLAKQAQVIVVTHLAQVAAFADNHLRVLKNQDQEFTATSVTRLSDVARVEELARMLSGLTDSELARGHAAELWQLAKSH